jgi:hypothetical protein
MRCKRLGTPARKWMAATLLVVAACGGSTDNAPAYVADWTTQTTVEAGGQSETAELVIPIQRNDTNVIELQGLCSDTDVYAAGPVADVTATGFTIRPGSCSFSSASCSAGSFGFAWTSGGGTLSNNQLAGSFSGRVSCGGASETYTITFTSTSKGAYGSSVRASGGHPLRPASALFRPANH